MQAGLLQPLIPAEPPTQAGLLQPLVPAEALAPPPPQQQQPYTKRRSSSLLCPLVGGSGHLSGEQTSLQTILHSGLYTSHSSSATSKTLEERSYTSLLSEDLSLAPAPLGRRPSSATITAAALLQGPGPPPHSETHATATAQSPSATRAPSPLRVQGGAGVTWGEQGEPEPIGLPPAKYLSDSTVQSLMLGGHSHSRSHSRDHTSELEMLPGDMDLTLLASIQFASSRGSTGPVAQLRPGSGPGPGWEGVGEGEGEGGWHVMLMDTEGPRRTSSAAAGPVVAGTARVLSSAQHQQQQGPGSEGSFDFQVLSKERETVQFSPSSSPRGGQQEGEEIGAAAIVGGGGGRCGRSRCCCRCRRRSSRCRSRRSSRSSRCCRCCSYSCYSSRSASARSWSCSRTSRSCCR